MKIKKLLPLVVSVALVLLIAQQASKLDSMTLKTQLAVIEPPFLTAIFALIIAFSILNFKRAKELFKGIKPRTWALLAVIFLLAFFIRAFLAPRTHRLFFDEDIYLDIAKEIVLNGKGSLCNYGNGGCKEYDLMKWPNGHPFLIAVSYLFFGISENTAFNLILLLSSLCIPLIFLVGYLLSNDVKVGLFSALALALIPIHILWSGTVASEPTLAFLILLSMLCFAISIKTRHWQSHALALFVLALAVQIKVDVIIIVPLFVLMEFLLEKDFFARMTEKKTQVMWILFFILIAPFLVHALFSFRTDTWGSEGDKFGLAYAQRNIPENLTFWINGYPTIEHPVLFTAFAVLGGVYLFGKDRRTLLFLSMWFLSFFLLYGFFYAGSVRYGVDVRYTLSYYPIFALFAGYGLASLSKKRFAAIILAAIVLASFYFYLPTILTPADKIEEAKQARVYHDFAVATAKNLDENCLILSHVPSIYLVMGKSSLQTWNANNDVFMRKLFNETDCIIFDDGFWCNIEPYKTSVCTPIFNNYNITLYAQVQMDTKPYSFYRVTQK